MPDASDFNPSFEALADMVAKAERDRGRAVQDLSLANWTSDGNALSKFNDIAYGSGVLAAVASNGIWATRDRGPFGTWGHVRSGVNLNRVIFGDSLFVAVGLGGIQTSSSGVAWVSRTPASGGGDLVAVAYGDGLYVAVETSGGIQTSPDGITWTRRTAAGSYAGDFRAVTHGDGVFVAVGTGQEVQTSPDGITWTQRTLDSSTSASEEPRTVIYDGAQFIVAGGVRLLQTSPDGTTWITQDTGADIFPSVYSPTSPDDGVHSLSFHDGMYVAGLADAAIFTSRDLSVWTRRAATSREFVLDPSSSSFPTPEGLFKIVALVYVDGGFVGVKRRDLPGGTELLYSLRTV